MRTPQLLRAALTVTGTLAVAAATAFVIKTVAATTVSGANSTPAPQTVVATAGPRNTVPPATAVTVTLPASVAETPVSLAPTAPTDTAAQPSAIHAKSSPVAGNQRPEDTVTVVYADDTGTCGPSRTSPCPGPWPSPGARTPRSAYVTATSFGSQLNCWITDATGATVTSQVKTRSRPPATR